MVNIVWCYVEQMKTAGAYVFIGLSLLFESSQGSSIQSGVALGVALTRQAKQAKQARHTASNVDGLYSPNLLDYHNGDILSSVVVQIYFLGP